MCGRPRDSSWRLGDLYFPSGAELASHLARMYDLEPDHPRDLMAVATSVEIEYGRKALYDQLRRVFDDDIPPTALHDFLARCPEFVRERGLNARPPVIVSTNYDDVLEHALSRDGEVFEVVAYVTDGPEAGWFRHYRAGGEGESSLITNPSTYDELGLDERITILKIHGTIDRADAGYDSYVISEDQYVEYLTTDIWDAIPAALIHRLRDSRFLFLGYAMRDWNLMVVMKRLRLLPPTRESWAIQLNPTRSDVGRWRERGFELLNIDLSDYAQALTAELVARSRER